MRDAKEPSTAGVLLRQVMGSDLPVFFEHQRDPEANRMAAFAARDREAFMAHWSKILEDESVVTKTIVANGQVAGNVVSWGQSGRLEIGYWLGQKFWGKGIATRALNAFLREVTTRPLYTRTSRRTTWHRSASWRSAGSRSRTRSMRHRTSPTTMSPRSS